MSEYTHRNGESEPPTEKGCFWYRGVALGERYEGTVTVATAIAGNLCVAGANESMYAAIHAWGNGQWWGPIVPPWKVAAREAAGE